MDNEQVFDPEGSDEALFMRCGGEQSWCVLGAQDADRMRIEGDDDSRSPDGACVTECPVNDGAVAEMHTVEDADGKNDRRRKCGEIGNRGEWGGVHASSGSLISRAPHARDVRQSENLLYDEGRIAVLQFLHSDGVF